MHIPSALKAYSVDRLQQLVDALDSKNRDLAFKRTVSTPFIFDCVVDVALQFDFSEASLRLQFMADDASQTGDWYVVSALGSAYLNGFTSVTPYGVPLADWFAKPLPPLPMQLEMTLH